MYLAQADGRVSEVLIVKVGPARIRRDKSKRPARFGSNETSINRCFGSRFAHPALVRAGKVFPELVDIGVSGVASTPCLSAEFDVFAVEDTCFEVALRGAEAECTAKQKAELRGRSRALALHDALGHCFGSPLPTAQHPRSWPRHQWEMCRSAPCGAGGGRAYGSKRGSAMRQRRGSAGESWMGPPAGGAGAVSQVGGSCLGRSFPLDLGPSQFDITLGDQGEGPEAGGGGGGRSPAEIYRGSSRAHAGGPRL